MSIDQEKELKDQESQGNLNAEQGQNESSSPAEAVVGESPLAETENEVSSPSEESVVEEATPVLEAEPVEGETQEETAEEKAASEESTEKVAEPVIPAEEAVAEEELIAEEDYSGKSIDELLAIAKELNTSKQFKVASSIFDSMQTVANKSLKEEAESAKAKFVEEGGEEDGFEYKKPETYNEFFAELKNFKKRKQEHFDGIRNSLDTNLKKKKALLDSLKTLTESTETSGSMAKVKEIQKEWKETGSVPKADADNLYKSYSALLDIFYDNKSIEHSLKELDRKKNLEAKLELIKKAEELTAVENVNEAAKKLNKLHEEFKHIGPVPMEQKEEVWSKFKGFSNQIYEKRRAIVEEFKEQLKENMVKKQELCLKLEPFVNYTSDKIKEWNQATKEILGVQKEWETIGALPKEVAKDINKQFWGDFKTFFAKKHAFLEKIDEERKDNLVKKEELCVQAEALKDSEEWADTADKLKELQKQWKAIGPVPQAQRESIFERFKAACDEFFNKKRNNRDAKQKEFEDNLVKKEALCTEISAMKLEEYSLDTFMERVKPFFEIGFVPRKDMHTILDKFLQAIENFFDKLEMEEEAREKARLEAQVEVFKFIPNAVKRLENKERAIRKKIEGFENDIALWVNNLEFFANSKTADKLRDEFTVKIDDAKEKVVDLKKQLKLIRSLNK